MPYPMDGLEEVFVSGHKCSLHFNGISSILGGQLMPYPMDGLEEVFVSADLYFFMSVSFPSLTVNYTKDLKRYFRY